jgi:hypothetical protein
LFLTNATLETAVSREQAVSVDIYNLEAAVIV